MGWGSELGGAYKRGSWPWKPSCGGLPELRSHGQLQFLEMCSLLYWLSGFHLPQEKVHGSGFRLFIHLVWVNGGTVNTILLIGWQGEGVEI